MTMQAPCWSLLLVGGDEDDCLLVTNILNDLFGKNFSLYWYTGETLPIHLVCSGLYDVVLTEYKIGSHDGLEFTKLVRERCSTVGLIMLTDWELPGLEKNALENGADAFLSKNKINPEILKPTLSSIFEKQPIKWNLLAASFQPSRPV